MLPLADESRQLRTYPLTTIGIIALACFAFLLELAEGEPFIHNWTLHAADILAGKNWITLLTAMFMHAGWLHLIGNMLFLWAFGPELEEAMGHLKYALFYIAGGLAAWAAQIFVGPASTIPALGASGAIAAVMGAFLVTYPRDKIRTLLLFGFFVRVIVVPAVFLIGFWFLLQLVSFGSSAEESGGVAYMAHIGGFIFGVLVGKVFTAGTVEHS